MDRLRLLTSPDKSLRLFSWKVVGTAESTKSKSPRSFRSSGSFCNPAEVYTKLARDGTLKRACYLGRDRSRGTEGKTYTLGLRPLVIDIDSPAVPSMPAGRRRIRELRPACRSRDEPDLFSCLNLTAD